jgi:hypothetical protein
MRWQTKIRIVHKFLRGWARNVVGENRKRKRYLLEQLDFLDIKSESSTLNQQERERESANIISCLN